MCSIHNWQKSNTFGTQTNWRTGKCTSCIWCTYHEWKLLVVLLSTRWQWTHLLHQIMSWGQYSYGRKSLPLNTGSFGQVIPWRQEFPTPNWEELAGGSLLNHCVVSWFMNCPCTDHHVLNWIHYSKHYVYFGKKHIFIHWLFTKYYSFTFARDLSHVRGLVSRTLNHPKAQCTQHGVITLLSIHICPQQVFPRVSSHLEDRSQRYVRGSTSPCAGFSFSVTRRWSALTRCLNLRQLT